ncbi:conserved hypothetical protein [Desulfofarcimen acetoxidans DSM 771]|jgi:hypothetical protein|uniref:DUF3006 domain-containing protein n=1 Tax=Desulfofarcimen acetoxidans (strain ATCC 49208 / DSM 771 / KCTC 5769 / VKM B-1644 / 5575) TaxID=485916 RepID=C8VYZ0_DESAS|nr:DUF3006 domain-containing protein [Desulfofarcimen acetoxidans]ACV62900.1 conserved hypothetical protein [Desulfofarcimen acetoxidans DSM 771]
MLIIDRFEEDQAVIEFGDRLFVIPKLFFPLDAKEGDVIKLKITVDREATSSRAKIIKGLSEELFDS